VVRSDSLTFHIISLGCSKNQVDSEYLKGAMLSAGFNEAEASDEADLLIVNTCGFITPAKEEGIDVILDAIEQKTNANSDSEFGSRVVVLGCLTERYHEEIKTEIPEIDLLYGVYDDKFVSFLCESFGVIPSAGYVRQRKPLIEGLAYSYIKIAEGCSNRCSYCAIPLIRGDHRSFVPEKIIQECSESLANGARELVIVAQDIAAYRSGNSGLPELLRQIALLDPEAWIRLMYCHPDHITDSIIDAIAGIPSVVKYIDLPFQHVSRNILRSMNRAGNAESYAMLIDKLRKKIPEIRIRSTFMVGFPGETDEDFRELVDFIKKAEIDRVGCFTYSPEEGTPAFSFGDPVPSSVKKKRYNRLMKIQQRISMARLQKMAGTHVRVLVEEKLDDLHWIGRTEYDAPEVDGIFYLTGRNLMTNRIYWARVTDSVEYDLIGEAIETK